MKLKWLGLLFIPLVLASCGKAPIEYKGTGEVTVPSFLKETVEEPQENNNNEPVEQRQEALKDPVEDAWLYSYDLLIVNTDESLVYKCAIPFNDVTITVEESWKLLYDHTEDEYFTDGIHPGAFYSFDYYKFPVGESYATLKVRGSTDESYSWSLKYVSSIEFADGTFVNLETSYLAYNGEYSNCIDYQRLDGDQIQGGTQELVSTDYGICKEFVIKIEGWAY